MWVWVVLSIMQRIDLRPILYKSGLTLNKSWNHGNREITWLKCWRFCGLSFGWKLNHYCTNNGPKAPYLYLFSFLLKYAIKHCLNLTPRSITNGPPKVPIIYCLWSVYIHQRVLIRWLVRGSPFDIGTNLWNVVIRWILSISAGA